MKILKFNNANKIQIQIWLFWIDIKLSLEHDAVISLEVIEHVEQPQEFLQFYSINLLIRAVIHIVVSLEFKLLANAFVE
jgi:hypothetical protein